MPDPVTRAELDAEAARRAGCVLLRRARRGGLVGLYRSDEAGMESDPDLPWSTVCEPHGSIVCHETRAAAVSALPYPDEWCQECQAAADRDVADANDRR